MEIFFVIVNFNFITMIKINAKHSVRQILQFYIIIVIN